MNDYHLSRLARIFASPHDQSSQDQSSQDQSSQDQSPPDPRVVEMMRNPYYEALLTTNLSEHYHPLPRILYEPEDRIDGYWNVTFTRPSEVWLQITIRPALHSDPPSHDWRSLSPDQIQAMEPITFRVSTHRMYGELLDLRRHFFSPLAVTVIPCETPETPTSDTQTVL
ncbi:uncharacterized protein FMAN_05434 [Fusarium mangiferae]|uniref:Uncharacterized protein n=1 Tax=Fusarium mangiferae TaxID=192010 RepID=A0A1L7SPL6_FUSMA|nr:uncharacterized protein FMAN_05434 [Fusarium mangiferae]CVK87649.1 uncharacterized protein FMAN_05434 [Fusarium mangiferae]